MIRMALPPGIIALVLAYKSLLMFQIPAFLIFQIRFATTTAPFSFLLTSLTSRNALHGVNCLTSSVINGEHHEDGGRF